MIYHFLSFDHAAIFCLSLGSTSTVVSLTSLASLEFISVEDHFVTPYFDSQYLPAKVIETSYSCLGL